jgi:hypothetical protein
MELVGKGEGEERDEVEWLHRTERRASGATGRRRALGLIFRAGCRRGEKERGERKETHRRETGTGEARRRGWSPAHRDLTSPLRRLPRILLLATLPRVAAAGR